VWVVPSLKLLPPKNRGDSQCHCHTNTVPWMVRLWRGRTSVVTELRTKSRHRSKPFQRCKHKITGLCKLCTHACDEYNFGVFYNSRNYAAPLFRAVGYIKCHFSVFLITPILGSRHLEFSLIFWKAYLSIKQPLTAYDPIHPQVSSRHDP
jgi:hypothetical protein